MEELEGHIIYLPPDTPRSGFSSVLDTPRSTYLSTPRLQEAGVEGQRLDFGGDGGEQSYAWPSTPRSLNHQDFIRYVL